MAHPRPLPVSGGSRIRGSGDRFSTFAEQTTLSADAKDYQGRRKLRQTFGMAILVICAVLVLITGCSTYYTVDQGERAVVLHFGAVAGEAEPGLHFKTPFVTTTENVSIQPVTYTYGGKTNPLEAYSQDQQPASLVVSVTFHVTNATIVYSQYGTIDQMVNRIFTPRVYENVKNVFGQYNAIEAIQNRAKLNAAIVTAVTQGIKGPFVIDGVQLQDIAFSQTYETAVENRMQAVVKQQQAEADKAKRIIDADAAAYEVKAKADADAHQIQVLGEAQADAIKKRGDALRDNPNLVLLTQAEKWDGHLPSTMVPGSAVPFLSVAK